MKSCKKCNKKKALSLFSISNKKKGTLSSYCKECCSIIASDWAKKNKERVRKNYKEWVKRTDYVKKNRKIINKYAKDWADNNKKKILFDNAERRKKSLSLYGIGLKTIRTYGLELALFVYDRAGRKCEDCFETSDLCIHHIDNNGHRLLIKGIKMNNEKDNLKILCRSCHSKLHARERKMEN